MCPPMRHVGHYPVLLRLVVKRKPVALHLSCQTLDFENSGTETCTWANSKCGCPSGAYRQLICYNNTQFDVVWNTAEGCLNGTSAGLSNVLRSSIVTDEDLTKCESGGATINGTSYASKRYGVCQGRPDFTPPVTVYYTGNGCSGTAFSTWLNKKQLTQVNVFARHLI